MVRKFIASLAIATLATLAIAAQASANTINLNSAEWLGHLKLEGKQLKEIKSAVEKALDSPIDQEQQCGDVRLDCVVRAAREWEFEGDKFREIVIHIHTIGHASRAVQQVKGKWPAVATK
ncbi:MAG: hypothetical protein OEZ43_13325 [Gammaproteobacteria bacterium]|nr:hypothetical protein [Gammaproteobacteria bacterium]